MHMLSVANFQNGGQAKEGNKKNQSDFAMNTQHTPPLEGESTEERYKTVWYWDRHDIKSIPRARFQLAKCI